VDQKAQAKRPSCRNIIKYRDKMEIRLDSSKISLLLFWFYKVSMFCTFREIHRRRKFLPIFRIPPEII